MAESKVALPGAYAREVSPWSFLLLLLIADLAYISLHLLLKLTPFVGNGLYSLVRDRGYAEVFQYMKELWIIVLLLSVYLKTKGRGYAAWALLFGYLLLDDSLQIHEKLGGVIGNALHFVPVLGLRIQDFGELLVSAVAGGVLLTWIGWCYLRGTAAFKQSSRHLLLLLFAVAFFGIFIDLLHMAFRMDGGLNLFWGTMEDGGEMVAISGVAAYAFLLNARGGDLGFSLRQVAVAALVRRSSRPRKTSEAV